MVGRIEFVVAGDSRDVIERAWGSTAWRSLADNGFVDRTTVSCVGFHRDIARNTLMLVLPKAFSAPNVRERFSEVSYSTEQIYRLIRVFQKMRRESRLALSGGDSDGVVHKGRQPPDPVLDSFVSALILRRDCFDRGIYVRKSEHFTQERADLPVDWARSMRKSTMILQDGEVFFNSTVHRLRSRDPFHPLTLLQIGCLREIMPMTGDNFDLGPISNRELEAMKSARSNPKPYLRALRGKTFDERGLFLIDSIGAYLGEYSLIGSGRTAQDDLLSYTKDFENIWELVLREMISPSMGSRDLPQGKWHVFPDMSEMEGMKPELDIRLRRNNVEVVIDAKDYRVKQGGKWTGSNGDHYKQVIYRYLLNEPKGSNVVNILAFPGFGQKSLFVIRGCHSWTELPGSSVYEVTVDYDMAMGHWLRESYVDVDGELGGLLKSILAFRQT